MPEAAFNAIDETRTIIFDLRSDLIAYTVFASSDTLIQYPDNCIFHQ